MGRVGPVGPGMICGHSQDQGLCALLYLLLSTSESRAKKRCSGSALPHMLRLHCTALHSTLYTLHSLVIMLPYNLVHPAQVSSAHNTGRMRYGAYAMTPGLEDGSRLSRSNGAGRLYTLAHLVLRLSPASGHLQHVADEKHSSVSS